MWCTLAALCADTWGSVQRMETPHKTTVAITTALYLSLLLFFFLHPSAAMHHTLPPPPPTCTSLPLAFTHPKDWLARHPSTDTPCNLWGLLIFVCCASSTLPPFAFLQFFDASVSISRRIKRVSKIHFPTCVSSWRRYEEKKKRKRGILFRFFSVSLSDPKISPMVPGVTAELLPASGCLMRDGNRPPLTHQ